MKKIMSAILIAVLALTAGACSTQQGKTAVTDSEEQVSGAVPASTEEKDASRISYSGSEGDTSDSKAQESKKSSESSDEVRPSGKQSSAGGEVTSVAEVSAESVQPSESPEDKESGVSETSPSEKTSSVPEETSAAESTESGPAQGSDVQSEAEESGGQSSEVQPSEQEGSQHSGSEESRTEPAESSETYVPTDPDAPVINYVHTMVDSIRLSWNSIKGADGYIVQYSLSGSLEPQESEFAETDGTEITLTGLSKNSTYHIRVCSYRREGSGQKTSSEWSAARTESLKSFEVIDGVVYIDGLVIANKTYALPAEYGDGLDGETSAAFYQMAAAAANDGIYIYIISDFRSYYTQSFTYNSFVYDRGVEQADRCSARPGHSEHQTGYAIDVNTTSDYFAYTPEAAWLERNCVRFGFIIRYPKDKEDITGYKYEPWHVRYVGTKKAAEITNSGLTVEEYYGITSVYPD